MGNFFKDGGFGKRLFGGKKVKRPPTVGQNLAQSLADIQKNQGTINAINEADLANAIEQFKKFAPEISESELDVLRKFGPLFQAENLESFNRAATDLQGQFDRSNPLAAELRNTLLKEAITSLQNPTGLDPALQREVEQGIRSAQTARGTSGGNSAVSAEAFARGTVGEELRRNRINAAQNILRTNTATGFNQQQAVPFTNFSAPPGNTVGGFNSQSANLFPGVFAAQADNNAVQSNIEQFNATRGARALQNFASLGTGIGTLLTGIKK